MLDRDRYRQYLLENMEGAITSNNGNEVICRCKYCNETGNHYHMNISIPRFDGEPSLFNCWKCHSSGFVTYETLLEWGIFDRDIALDLTEHYKNSSKYYASHYSGAQYKMNKGLYIANDPKDDNKLEYINYRLGLKGDIFKRDITTEIADSLKIITNLKSFLSLNNIYSYTRADNIVDQLSKHFVGFLSIDNSHVILRKIDDAPVYDSINERYINYRIFDPKDRNKRKFYCLPQIKNQDEPYQIVITEGVFDALGYKYHVTNQLSRFNNIIYLSAGGNSFIGALHSLLTLYPITLIAGSEIILAIDSDGAGQYPIKEIENFIKTMMPWVTLYIAQNYRAKDFGVSSDEIQVYMTRRN